MDYELPTEFDVIVVGTGIVESIISAAASRVGKRVLHIDSNNYYGGVWSSFSLDGIQQLATAEQTPIESFPIVLEHNESMKPIGNNLFNLKDFEIQWHIPDVIETASGPELPPEVDSLKSAPIQWCKQKLLQESRRFNLDLTPKLQFARGDFVELLISSNIARYSEYRSVSRVLTWLNDRLETVPCSRSDVFANNKVSVIEKRMLMKLFLALDAGEQEYTGYENKTFRAFLKDRKLTPNLIHYVLYAIAMANDETSCLEGVQRTKRFLNSLGRFGKTPFLFSMYGSGEIAQGFCRLSAVFGGIYALNQPLNGFIFGDDSFKGVATAKQRIAAEFLVMGAEKASPEFVKQLPKSYISRAIFITDKSVMASDKEHLTLLLYPPEKGHNACVVIELGTLTGTCPKVLVHAIAQQSIGPKDDFKDIVNNLFRSEENDKPNILWSCYFSVPNSNDLDLKTGIPNKCVICPGPDFDLDYDHSVKIAKSIFTDMYPESDFLPRAPDPDEIITDVDSTDEQAIVLELETVKDEQNQETKTEE